MRRPIHLTPLAFFLLCAGGALAMAAPTQPPAPLRDPPPEPKGDTVHAGYWGQVTELTKASIVIRFDCQPDRIPKTFQLSETLAAGKVPMEPRMFPTPVGPQGYHVSPSQMYRLADVQVGDWVAITYARVNGIDICDHIKISKRPGGRVPPLPDEAEALLKPGTPRNLARYIPYHERMNAYWDLEDKGIPYPEKFGDQRRFPVAPMPREVKPLVPIDPPGQ